MFNEDVECFLESEKEKEERNLKTWTRAFYVFIIDYQLSKHGDTS